MSNKSNAVIPLFLLSYSFLLYSFLDDFHLLSHTP